MKERKNGITLIALVITIIVLLILAGVAVSIGLNGDNLFSKANEAKTEWNKDISEEQTKVTELIGVLEKMEPTTETIISKELTINNGNGFVGYYADFDGIPGVDGIIYVDLLVKKPSSGQWADSQGAYIIPTDVNASNVKDYVISEEPIVDERFEKAGANPSTYTPRYVISPASSSTGTKDRFYVMGLDNITVETNSTLYFFNNYFNKITDEDVAATSVDFGKGKENTLAMLRKLETEILNDRDIWKQVKAKQQEYAGWFVPSVGEFAAFSAAFNLDTATYTNYKLGDYYWTSTLSGTSGAWCVKYSKGYMGPGNGLSEQHYARLSTTF